MNVKNLKKDMTVYELAGLMMAGFERIEQKMATKEDLEKVKKELKKDIAATNQRLDKMKLFIPSLI
jgi:3-methyladenine DNA glycosylase AlkD